MADTVKNGITARNATICSTFEQFSIKSFVFM